MSKRWKKPVLKETAVEVPVTVAEPAVPAVKAARPVAVCFRCGRTGDGLLCRRCEVVLHGRSERDGDYVPKYVAVTKATGY